MDWVSLVKWSKRFIASLVGIAKNRSHLETSTGFSDESSPIHTFLLEQA
jgi:hypothetical protein